MSTATGGSWRLGVPIDHGHRVPDLRVLPGRPLFDCLAALLDRGAIQTDQSGAFRIENEVDL